MRSTPATSGHVSARAVSADRRGAEPPLSPVALPTSRLVDCARFDPAPHPYIGKSGTSGYNFRPSSRATARRSFRGERWPLSRAVGTGEFYVSVAARESGHDGERKRE